MQNEALLCGGMPQYRFFLFSLDDLTREQVAKNRHGFV